MSDRLGNPKERKDSPDENDSLFEGVVALYRYYANLQQDTIAKTILLARESDLEHPAEDPAIAWMLSKRESQAQIVNQLIMLIDVYEIANRDISPTDLEPDNPW